MVLTCIYWGLTSWVRYGCMRQALRAGALGRPRGMGWRARWEGGWGWVTHVNPWLIHVNVWQKPLQYCKVISLQLIKINGKKNKPEQKKLKKNAVLSYSFSNIINSFPWSSWGSQVDPHKQRKIFRVVKRSWAATSIVVQKWWAPCYTECESLATSEMGGRSQWLVQTPAPSGTIHFEDTTHPCLTLF